MDFRRLEAFSKVYEHRSFSKAGNELFLSQPTISAHVSSLEKELGVLLFDRLGRTILPTSAGDILYRHARESFDCLGRAQGEIELLRDKVAGELMIGASTIPSQYVLPEVLARFIAAYPDVQVVLRGGDSAGIVRMVDQGGLMLGVTGAREERSGLAFKPVRSDELVVLAPEVMAPDGPVPFKVLLEKPWVMREQGSGTRRTFESGLEEHGVDARALRCVAEVETTQAALQCVRAGMGLTVTSRLAAQSLLCQGGVRIVDVQGLRVKRHFYCVYNEHRHMFPALRYFIDFFLKQTAAS